MLDLEKIRRWYNNAPAPVVWLLAIAYLFLGLLVVSSFFLVLDGGYQELVSTLPSHAKEMALKLLWLFSALLVAYFVFRVVGFLIERRDRLRRTMMERQVDRD